MEHVTSYLTKLKDNRIFQLAVAFKLVYLFKINK